MYKGLYVKCPQFLSDSRQFWRYLFSNLTDTLPEGDVLIRAKGRTDGHTDRGENGYDEPNGCLSGFMQMHLKPAPTMKKT